jgi:ArsR family transcriptional regulator
MKSLLKAIEALSDETRLRMINIMTEEECCVCEVMTALEISQTRASRNLSLLYDAGFLNLRKDGLWSYYSLKKADLSDELVKLVDAVKTALKKDNQTILDKNNLECSKRTTRCCKDTGKAELKNL